MSFLTKLRRLWCNVVISTLRVHCVFDVAISTLYQRCHYSNHDIYIYIYIYVLNYYPTLRQRWPVLNLTSKYGRWRDVANLTSRFQRCCNSVVVTTSMVYSKLNLLSNVQATLELRWNVHVHGSTHQLHRKVFTLLCICLMVLGRWLILFNCELCK